MPVSKPLYALIGAGGFGREVMPLAQAQLTERIAAGEAELVFVVEGERALTEINGIPVLTMEEFRTLSGERYFNIAIADSAARQRIAEACIADGMHPFTIRAANAVVQHDCDIGEGAILCSFVAVNSNAKIGRFFHANIYSYVAHDCHVGDFVTLAPKAACNGRICLEDHSYIGTGAVLKEGTPISPLVIGRGAIVGMGAVVTRSVAAETTVVGNPARPLNKSPST